MFPSFLALTNPFASSRDRRHFVFFPVGCQGAHRNVVESTIICVRPSDFLMWVQGCQEKGEFLSVQ